MKVLVKVFSSVLDKVFETKRKYANGFKENMKSQQDKANSLQAYTVQIEFVQQ